MCAPDNKTVKETLAAASAAAPAPMSEATKTPLTNKSNPHDDDDDQKHQTSQQRHEQHALLWATRLGAASSGLLLMATTMTMPYLQAKRDELGCTASCQGQMTSARSTLLLLGAAIVGKVSDAGSGSLRRVCLWVGVAAAAVSLTAAHGAQTISQLWWSVAPLALQQNLAIVKALFSDYHAHWDDTDKTGSKKDSRAASAGLLGMSGGLALMLGPFLGSSLLSTYDQAVAFAMLLLAASAVLIFWLPTVPKQQAMTQPPSKSRLFQFLDVPSARTPAALYALGSRLLSTLSYHVYAVIWPASLQARFQFGPPEYGLFFSVVGLFFALSQGLVAKRVLAWCAGDTATGRARLMATCHVITSVMRIVALRTPNLYVMYATQALLISAVGVSTTILSADATQIPKPAEAGAFFGLVAAAESGAGMAGPLLASALLHWSPAAPLAAAVGLNLIAAVVALVAYDVCVFQHIARQKQRQQQQAATPKHEKQE